MDAEAASQIQDGRPKGKRVIPWHLALLEAYWADAF